MISSPCRIFLNYRESAEPAACIAKAPTRQSIRALLVVGRLRPILLRCLVHLRVRLAYRLHGTRTALFSPCIQPFAMLLQVAEELWIRKHRPPRWHQVLDRFPHSPLLARILKKQLFINQPAVRNARHHLPVAQHHPHVRAFLTSGRRYLHRFVGALWTKIPRHPFPRFPQLRLSSQLVQMQHQVHLLVCRSHVFSSFYLRNNFVAIFFHRSLFASTAATPPVETADAISIAVVAMHAGHISFS